MGEHAPTRDHYENLKNDARSRGLSRSHGHEENNMEVRGSDHYKMGKIEPIEYIEANGLSRGFYAGNIIKYVTRYCYTDDPIGDLEKARHYLDLLIEVEKKAHQVGRE
jgi:hypothetical protein